MKVPRYILLIMVGLLALTACGQKPLLEDVSVEPQRITPNADGREDLAKIEFLLNRSATLSISFLDENGKAYIFRNPTPLGLNEEPYSVFFGGVVEGFSTDEEDHDF
ncbi:MAG: lipoprotein, partial [Anaerolineae bacterium]|nr:lipoprotein [Anaerolineae bacterium]